jgi:hypothetical protein
MGELMSRVKFARDFHFRREIVRDGRASEGTGTACRAPTGEGGRLRDCACRGE